MGYVGKIQDTAGNRHLVGSTLYGTCSTAASETTKVVTCSDFLQLVTGVTIHVKFSNSNSSSAMDVKLNVNSTGAKSIVGMLGTNAYGTGISWNAGSVVSFTYDGTFWVMNDSYWVPKTDTKVTQAATTTNSNYPILFKNSANQTDETDQVRYGNTSNKVPKINPSTGNLSATTFNGYTLGAACEKGVDASIPSSGWSATNVPTTAAVANYVASAVSGGNAFMGSLVASGGNASTTWTDAQVQAASYTKGQYWVCSAAGTYCGKVLEAGDMLFCVSDKSSAYSANDFSAVQNNIETLTTTEVSNLWTAAVAVS